MSATMRWVLGGIALSAMGSMLGCGDHTESPSDPGGGSGGEDGRHDDDDPGDDGGPGDDDGGGGAREGQTEACRRYVACVAATAPALASDIDDTYGESGSCWEDEELRDACDEGCAEGLAYAYDHAPNEDHCRECEVDADCATERPHCDDARCVECAEDDDCASGVCGGDGTCASAAIACGEDFWARELGLDCASGCSAIECAEELEMAASVCSDADLCCVADAASDCGGEASCMQAACDVGPPCTDAFDRLVMSCIGSCCG